MAPNQPMLPVRDLLLPHADVLVDETGTSMIGKGWRAIAEALFEACAADVRQTPGARVRVTDCTERTGQILVVFDVLAGMPPDALSFHGIHRLQGDAETRSLRTCVCCGEPGVLRRVADGFATRCADHAEPASGRLDRAHDLVPLEVLVNALRSHETWLENDADTSLFLPMGWLPLFVELLAALRLMPGAAAGLRLLMVGAVCGRLEMRCGYDEACLSEPDVSRMRATLLAAGDDAFFTCDVCGAPGWLRMSPTGEVVPAPRCPAHAALWRLPSVQSPTCDRSSDPVNVISSARCQWDIDVLRAMVPGRRARASEPASPRAFALYDVRDVASAMGLASEDVEGDDDFGIAPPPADTEQLARLRRILQRGDAGRWRRLAHPDGAMVERLNMLAARTPHLDALTSFVRRHLLAAITMDLPVSLPPVLLVGPPGVGKSFLATALSGVLNLPYRDFPMTSASHSDSIGGSHGVWRNASTGLVAKLLLGQEIANGVLFIDEFDKASGGSVDDPYRPFYSLLEPLGARRFVDAYLGFAIDASAILWILAANETTSIPRPILDRLTIIRVGAPDPTQLAAIARSVYGDCNARRAGFFPKSPSKALVDRLTGMTPRAMRIAIEDAMTGAAAAGRRIVRAEDLTAREGETPQRIGFL